MLQTSFRRSRCIAPMAACALGLTLAMTGVVHGQEADSNDADVEAPRLLEKTPPRYPAAALEASIDAVVVLTLDIDEEGRVIHVEVRPVQGEAADLGFEEAAVAAAKTWRFSPARRGDEAVASQIAYTLRFVAPRGEPHDSDRSEPSVVRLSGQVLERGTGDPLAGVRIVVFRGEGNNAAGLEAWSDEGGRFAFYDLEDGVWNVLVENEGHHSLRTQETIQPSKRLELTYRLERAAYNVYDVLVESETIRNAVSRRQVETEELELMPGIYGDPVKVLRALPGVAKTNAFTADIVVRGGAPKDTQFFVMGLPIPAAFHFGGFRGLFPEGLVDRLVLYAGDYPAYYGRSLGGVVDIVLPQTTDEQVHGYVDVSLLDTTLFVDIPVTDTLWVAGSLRRSYLDAVIGGIGIAFEEDLLLPRYYDAHAQVGWRPSAEHYVRAFVMTADDDFVVYSLKDDPIIDEETLPETSMVQSGVQHAWVPSTDLALTTAFLVGWNRDLRFGTLAGHTAAGPGLTGLLLETTTLRFAGRSDAEVVLGPAATLRFGGEVGASAIDLDIALNPNEVSVDVDGDLIGVPSTDDLHQTVRDAGAYTEVALTWPGSGFLLTPGMRVDYFGRVRQTTFDPRLRAQWDINERWQLHGAVGRMHQAPQPLEVLVELGGDDLRAERATQSSAGVVWRPWDTFSAELTGFYKKLDGLVELEFLPLPPRWSNAGMGRVYGAETLLRFPLRSRFNGWIAYTISKSERFNRTTNNYETFAFDQTHNLTVFASYRLPANWSLSARFQYASGFPLYDAIGDALDRSTDFHQLDVRADKTWIYDTWTLQMYLDVQNVYNRFNLSSANTSSSGDNPESFVDPPGVPILPIIGAKARF